MTSSENAMLCGDFKYLLSPLTLKNNEIGVFVFENGKSDRLFTITFHKNGDRFMAKKTRKVDDSKKKDLKTYWESRNSRKADNHLLTRKANCIHDEEVFEPGAVLIHRQCNLTKLAHEQCLPRISPN